MAQPASKPRHSGGVTGYNYGDCRLLGHSWFTVPSDWTPLYGVPMTARCERCTLERRDSINRFTGEVQGRRYTYPDGYLFDTTDEEAPKRTDFRVAWLDQHLPPEKDEKKKKG